MSPVLLCCWDCGTRYSARKDKETRCITVSEGTCDVCGETKMVSPAYDYGGLREEWKDHRKGKG